MNKFFHIAEELVALLKVLNDKTQKSVPLSYYVKPKQFPNYKYTASQLECAIILLNHGFLDYIFFVKLSTTSLMNIWWACLLHGATC